MVQGRCCEAGVFGIEGIQGGGESEHHDGLLEVDKEIGGYHQHAAYTEH